MWLHCQPWDHYAESELVRSTNASVWQQWPPWNGNEWNAFRGKQTGEAKTKGALSSVALLGYLNLSTALHFGSVCSIACRIDMAHAAFPVSLTNSPTCQADCGRVAEGLGRGHDTEVEDAVEIVAA